MVDITNPKNLKEHIERIEFNELSLKYGAYCVSSSITNKTESLEYLKRFLRKKRMPTDEMPEETIIDHCVAYLRKSNNYPINNR